jgi:hypothetical protein
MVGRSFGNLLETVDAQAWAADEKEAVRLRKRFQLIKDKLRQMALEQGLDYTAVQK